MIENSYFRLQENYPNEFILDCPVEIEKGALLLEIETKNVLLQLHFNALIPEYRKISSITVVIDGYDDIWHDLSGVIPIKYTFKDVFLLGNRGFGDKLPIELDPRIRKVKVKIERVTMTSGEEWRFTGGEITPKKQRTLNSLDSYLLEQLKRDISSLPLEMSKRFVYFPEQTDDYWLCTCGRPNVNDTNLCGRCGNTKTQVFTLCDEVTVQRNLDNYFAERAERKKKIQIASLSVIGVGLLVIFSIYVISPFIKYQQASKYLENKEYDQAIALFAELEDYWNAPDMIIESNYRKAGDLLDRGEYDESLALFSELTDYKNSPENVSNISYILGKQLLNEEKFERAFEILNQVNKTNYPDIETLVHEAEKGLKSTWKIEGDVGRNVGLTYETIFLNVKVMSVVNNNKTIDLNGIWLCESGFKMTTRRKNIIIGEITQFSNSFTTPNPKTGKSEKCSIQFVNQETNKVLAEYEFTISK